MRKIIVISLMILLAIPQNFLAQPTVKGVLLKNSGNLKKGETVDLIGYKKATGSAYAQYIIMLNGEVKYLAPGAVKPNDPNIDFWNELWFLNRSQDAIQNNWDISLRNQLKSDFDSYAKDLLDYKLVFKDELLDDYLSQLINKICPHPIYKGKDYYLKVLVIKATEKEIFSFDNGIIIISTGLLSQVKSEKELVYYLSKEVANVILDINLVNLKQQIKAERSIRFWTGLAGITTLVAADISQNKNMDTYKRGFTYDDAELLTLTTCLFSAATMDKMGTRLSEEQMQQADLNAQSFIGKKYSNWPARNPDDFTRVVANVLTYSAWQSFYKIEYAEVKVLLDRLENAKLLTEDGYLLKAKMYRTLYSTDESVYEAIHCLKNAEEIGMSELVDIYKEYGILYLRLKDNVKAITYFEKYKEALQRMQPDEQNLEELRWVGDIISRYKS
jgi:hypothetical protein